MTRKMLYLAIAAFLVSVVWVGWLAKDKIWPEKPVHYHAGFMVVKDNQKIDFSNPLYMTISPCTNGKVEESAAAKQNEKAHLHDKVGDVIHVEATGAIWKDLFTNIHYYLDYASVAAYLNGQQVPNFQNLAIKPDDSLVVFLGSSNDVNKFLSQAVTKQYIEEAGSKSEDCGAAN